MVELLKKPVSVGLMVVIIALLSVANPSYALIGSMEIDRTLIQESVGGSIVSPPQNDGKTEKIEQLLQRYRQTYRFNGNVLVTRNNVPIFSGSAGYAHMGRKEQLDLHHAFQLASVSKQFTAMGIMILAERGLIDFDDPVSNYICGLDYPGMTLRQLLNHTSGIQNYMWLLEKKWKQDRIPSNKEVIEFMVQNKLPLNFKPGSRFAYSNTGYMLLAYIIEEASGLSFSDFMDRYIFEPLEMHDAFVEGTTDPFRTKYIVSGYRAAKRGYYRVGRSVNDGAHGDKGIYASIVDLYKWDVALNNHTLVSRETMNEALTPGRLRNRRYVPYGFGFRLRIKNGYPMVYHQGIWNGFRSSYVKNQRLGTTIIVLNNTDSRVKDQLVRDIQAIMQS